MIFDAQTRVITQQVYIPQHNINTASVSARKYLYLERAAVGGVGGVCSVGPPEGAASPS